MPDTSASSLLVPKTWLGLKVQCNRLFVVSEMLS